MNKKTTEDKIGVRLLGSEKCLRDRTMGHENIIRTCLEIFDAVTVAIMVNPDKKPLLTEEERELLLKKLFADDMRVKICVFDGAAVDLLEQENTKFYVRGVRDCIVIVI